MTLPTIANRQWIYRRPPLAAVGPEHYEQVTTPLSTGLAAGEVLIAARYFSVDPYMRINQARATTWMDPHPIDTVQSGATVGTVLASADPAYAPGDWVTAYSGWQTHARVHGSALAKIDGTMPTAYLGVLGMPGRTAWFGLTEAGRPKPGETVVVSGAGGAVGSLVVQYAKRHGARVVAIAGGAAKCDWIRTRLGADLAIDYRAAGDAATLSALLDRHGIGVDVYFDNVGGWISDALLPRIRRRARIVICGQISQYSGGLDTPELGPRLLQHLLYQRATIQGVLARDYLHRMDEMLAIVEPWVRRGEVVFEETIVDGFAQLPAALGALFGGEHRGKLIVATHPGERP